MRLLSKFLSTVLFALIFIPSVVHGQAYNALWLGTPMHDQSGSFFDLYLDTANRRAAYGVLPPVSKTTSVVRIYVADRIGTLGATDGVLDIYNDASGKPGTSLDSATFNPNTTGWKDVTISEALTAGTQYWFVIRNDNGVPGSNTFAMRAFPDGLAGTIGGGLTNNIPRYGAAFNRSDDGGTSWDVTTRANGATYRIQWSDSSYTGFPGQYFDSASTPIVAGDRVYDAREVGNLFTTPQNVSPKVDCVSFHIAKIGTPTGNVKYSLYAGTTFVADTASLGAISTLAQSGYLPLCFSATQTLTANTAYRVVIRESAQTDASSDAYGPSRVDVDTDANSLALKVFGGTISKTICTGASSCNGGTWTDTTGSYYPMQLLLKPGDEFASSGGGGSGGLTIGNMSGGFQ